MPRTYYYLDVELPTLAIISLGESDTATLTGDTENPTVHRVFLTKGQFNKLRGKLAHHGQSDFLNV